MSVCRVKKGMVLNMKKILFVIAMEKEALEIKEKLQLIQQEDYTGILSNKVYRKENISMLITGIGKQQTAISLTIYLENNKLEKPDIIINIGYAGSTNSNIGEWVNVSKSYNYEWNIPGEQRYSVEGFNNDIIKVLNNPSINKLPCYSAESFVTSTEIKEDVVFDMELHSIYLICCIYGINLISLKKVSDNLNLDDYYKNIDMKDVMELKSGLELLNI